MTQATKKKRSTKKAKRALPVITDAAELPALLTAEQVAGYLQVSLSAVYQWIEKGLIPHRRLPGARTIRFDKADILNWKEGASDGQ